MAVEISEARQQSTATAALGARTFASGSGGTSIVAEAWLLGARLDLRAIVSLGDGDARDGLATTGPSVTGFRYGVVVFFGVDDAEQRRIVDELAPHVHAPLDAPERDRLAIRIDAEVREGLGPDGVLALRSLDADRLQVVAHVLAKSTALSHTELRVADVFSGVELRAQALDLRPSRRRTRELLRDMRDAIAIQVRTVGRVEMTEKPEITWDAPELDRLYEHLAIEFELRERDTALSRKLALISQSASMALELVHARQNLRVEWYIVILILVEIALSLWRWV